MKPAKGKYEVFEVGDELVFSDDRDKIKEYAKKKGIEKIKYRLSFESKDGAKSMAREL